MKKTSAILLTFIMLFSAFSLTALAGNDKVEISFCVGDDTLIINGEAVTVEKPYVVGAGVTLVPIRVITEAFGAKVDWNGDTKTVYLDYAGTSLVLQIDNPIAKINGEEKELLSPPELTSNGFTMVPIRFISENFGAEVGYDPDTKRVTVTGEKKADDSSMWKLEEGLCYSEDFGISLNLPADFELAEGNTNEILLETASLDKSLIEINIYSKESVTSSSSLGRKIIAETKYRYNGSAVSSDTDVSSVTYKNFKGHEYSGEVKATELKGVFKNVFFENGSFVYNIALFSDSSAGESFIENVLNSVSLSEPKASDLFERKVAEALPPVNVSELSRCDFTIPGDFTAVDKEAFKFRFTENFRSDKLLIYSDGKITFHARRIFFDPDKKKDENSGYQPEGKYNFDDIKKYISNGSYYMNSNFSVYQPSTVINSNDKKFYKIVLENERWDYTHYYEIFATESNDAMFLFYVTYPEIHYSMDNRSKIMSIIKTIEFDEEKNKD